MWGLSVTQDDDDKPEVLCWHKASIELRLINPSVLVACRLLVANPNKAGQHLCPYQQMCIV